MNPSPMALLRFQAISAYVTQEPPRGSRRAAREKLAEKSWLLPDGRPVSFSAETLRSLVRRYREGGLEALDDKARPVRGVQALSEEQVELFCKLKQEVPERSLDRLLRIAEEMKLVEPGVVCRSTLHRALQARGLSGRPPPGHSAQTHRPASPLAIRGDAHRRGARGAVEAVDFG